jgi:hypothetical protein
VKIGIRNGHLIDLIRFFHADKSVQSWGSETGGSEAPEFALAPDENIVRIVARQGDSLDGLRFYTSHGRESQWYGGHGGTQMEFEASPDDPIVALERGSGFCPRIVRAIRLSAAR